MVIQVPNSQVNVCSSPSVARQNDCESTSYYSRKDLEKVWDQLGGATPMPPLNDTCARYIRLKSVSIKTTSEVVRKLAKEKRLRMCSHIIPPGCGRHVEKNRCWHSEIA